MNDIASIDRVRGAERIASLDVLRGIAILFILFMNIPWMGGLAGPPTWELRYPTWTPADYWTTLVIEAFLAGTQRGLLELLFGAGIIIMARRAMTGDGPVEVADLHYRRNLWLILFGLFNALVLMWHGDILLVYGIAAMFLFPFRRVGPKRQLAFAALLLAALTFVSVKEYREAVSERAAVARIAGDVAAGKSVTAEDKARVDEQRKRDQRRLQGPADADHAKQIEATVAKRHGGIVDYWGASVDGWKVLVLNFLWPIEAEIAATMLIGMALFQWGVIQGKARGRTYLLMVIAGYGLGLALRATTELHRLSFAPGPIATRQLDDIARIAVTLGHLGLVHLLLRAAVGRRLLSPFVAAGRMPLSIYLFTSFLMMWVIFAPWGFGMFGRWGMAQLMAVAAVIIAAELVTANLWMRHFENGPMEWLWKSLAYERREPFRKRGVEPAEAMPSPA